MFIMNIQTEKIEHLRKYSIPLSKKNLVFQFIDRKEKIFK